METMWTFNTKRFAVKWMIETSTDPDLSFDETGETAKKIASGEWFAFDSKMAVYLDGEEIAADYLGESIYANPADFRDHIGRNAGGYGSYFSDMVRGAVRVARQEVIARLARPAPYIRPTS